ncbi:MAG: hypothetical protein ACYCWW_12315 [Deltaproteobacteria bacterium]
MTATLLTSLFAASLTAAPAPKASPPATAEVEAQGEAAVVNGDEGAAVEQAREAALREAVSKVAGTLVSSDTLTDGSILVSDRIYAHSAGYVKTWSYVDKPQVADGTATVHLKAVVGTAELDRDLEAVRALLERKNKPRVVVLISEQDVGSAQPFAWWAKGQKAAQGGLVSMDLGTFENGFMGTLQKFGWRFVDHQVLDGKIEVQRAVTTDLSNQVAASFGKLASAEIAIYGKVVAESPGQSELAPGMFAAHANVSLRAVACDDGSLLATVDESVGDPTTLDVSAENAGVKALRLASKKAALEMQQKILERWKGEVSGTSSITLKVGGLPSYRALRQLESVLGSSVRGVRAVREQTVDGPDAVVQLELEGDSHMLAAELDGRTIKGLSIDVRHVSANELDVRLSK